MAKKIIQLFFVFLLCLFNQQAFAVKDYIIERAYFEDKTAQLNFEEAKNQNYEPMGQMLAKGYSPSAFWIRLKIEGDSHSQTLSENKIIDKLILRVQPSYLDDIRLFDSMDSVVKSRVTGDHYSADADEYSSLNFNFVIPKLSESRYVWLRLKTTSTNLLQVQAVAEEDCARLDKIQEFGFAFYFAVLCLLFLAPLVIWIGSKDFLVGVFILKQFGAITLLVFSAGYMRFLFKEVDLEILQFLMNLNLVAYTFITLFFHYAFLSEYVLRPWAKKFFILAMYVLPVELLLLVFKLDRQALHLNMFLLNTVTLTFLVMPIYGVNWDETKSPIFSRKRLFVIHLLIIFAAVSTTLPSLGYLQGNPFSAISGLAYGGITGIIFFLILQYRFRLSREKSIAKISSVEAYAEAEKERGERQAQFLAMLTHELKTPLSIMKMGYSSTHQSDKLKKHIQTAIDDMTNVIDRCIMDDKLENHEFQLIRNTCDLNQIIFEVVSPYDDSSKVQIISDKVYIVNADIQLLRICISNLVDNALKYGDEQVPVAVEISDSIEQDYLQISVRNTVGSVGMPNTEKIFDKYYRAPKAYEKTGSGLGLYLVKRFVELMSGQIECYCEGSQIIFTIRLPKSR